MSALDIGLIVLAGGRATRMQDSLRGRSKLDLPIGASRESLLRLLLSRAERLGWPAWVVADPPHEFAARRSLTGFNGASWVCDPGVGTARAIRSALDSSSCNFYLILNCDTLFPFDPFAVAQYRAERGCVLHLSAVASTQNMGLVGVDRTGVVIHWGEPSQVSAPSWARAVSSSGAYVACRDMLRKVLGEAESWEREVLPLMVSSRNLRSITANSAMPIVDFGTESTFYQIVNEATVRHELIRVMGLVPVTHSRIA